MTDECISPLRRRMIEDMTVRNFVAKTQIDYVRRVKNFTIFLGRSPDTATREDVRRYLLHLASSGMGAGSVNGAGSALRFLFDITLDRPDIVQGGGKRSPAKNSQISKAWMGFSLLQEQGGAELAIELTEF